MQGTRVTPQTQGPTGTGGGPASWGGGKKIAPKPGEQKRDLQPHQEEEKIDIYRGWNGKSSSTWSGGKERKKKFWKKKGNLGAVREKKVS